MTQDALSEKLEMTQGGLQHWLAGTRQPSLDQINQIAKMLGVAPAWLTHGIDQLDTLDGLGQVARATLRRFIAAERRQTLPATVWNSLNATADLAIPDAATPQAPHAPLTNFPVPNDRTGTHDS